MERCRRTVTDCCPAFVSLEHTYCASYLRRISVQSVRYLDRSNPAGRAVSTPDNALLLQLDTSPSYWNR